MYTSYLWECLGFSCLFVSGELAFLVLKDQSVLLPYLVLDAQSAVDTFRERALIHNLNLVPEVKLLSCRLQKRLLDPYQGLG